jgi:hypothetical protein
MRRERKTPGAAGVLAAALWSVAAGAAQVDVAIGIDDGRDFAQGGGATDYIVMVENAGPDPVHRASVTVTPSASVLDLFWTCVTDRGTPCANAQGVGRISETVDLAAGAAAIYHVTTTIKATPEHPLILPARVRVHGDETDRDGADNDASDTDVVGIFAADFDRPPP